MGKFYDKPERNQTCAFDEKAQVFISVKKGTEKGMWFFAEGSGG